VNNSRTMTATNDVSIGNININAPQATNAGAIAREIRPAIEKNLIPASANYSYV
jgi:hypothetical protein